MQVLGVCVCVKMQAGNKKHCMYQQAFCIHFKDVQGEGSHDCIRNGENVLERGILQPGHSAVSLTTVPHCTDCSCAQC